MTDKRQNEVAHDSDLNKAKQALRESEKRFANLAAVFPVAIFRFDATAENCTYVNEHWGKLVGRPLASALGLGYQDFIHPDDLPKLREYNKNLQQAATLAVGETLEARHILTDGTFQWFQVNMAKELDEQGNITGYLATLTDISKVKRAEEGRKKLNQRHRKVLEFSSIGMFEWYFEEEKLVWDDQMFKIYGVDPSTFRGVFEDWADRLHPDDLEKESVKSWANGDFRIVRPDGKVRQIYRWVYYEEDENNQRLAIGLNLDITEQHQANLALLESENKFTRVAEGIPGMILRYILRPDGSHAATYISSQCKELFQVEPQDVINNVDILFNRIHPDDVTTVQNELRDSMKSLQPVKVVFRVSLPEKGLRWLQALGRPVKTGDGNTSWDGVVLDITERKEMELANDALAKATKTKDQFIANMSHELRTPLSAILAMTEGIQQGLFGTTTPRQLESLSVIEQSGLHLLELINEVLDLAKIGSGQPQLELSNVEVLKICQSSLSLIGHQAEKKEIELSLNVAWNLPKIVADETRLRQVLINLLNNAIKFTPNQGKVGLAAKTCRSLDPANTTDVLQISITDNGIGIASEKLESLFEPFVQLDNSMSRCHEGTGLGLALARQFVELHHGKIHVQSELGEGSCFIVELPFQTESSEESPKRIDEPPANALKNKTPNYDSINPATILLAEDNDHVALAVTRILEASDYRVTRAENGQEAIDLTRDQTPDLILMDIQMPMVDGLEAIRQIRSIDDFAKTPIIALSGLAMPEDSARCIEAGASSFASKPCRMQELIVEIDKLLATTPSS